MSSDLQERLAMALCGTTPDHWRAISGATKKSALEDVEPLLPIVRQAQAEAWDQGCARGKRAYYDNPYREETPDEQ